MTKKILGYTFVLVLLSLAYIFVFRGVNISGYEVLSLDSLVAKQQEHDKKIQDYDKALQQDYYLKLRNLKSAQEKFETNKQAYEELKSYNSYEDLLELTRDKSYQLELIWIKLDIIARNNNLAAQYNLVNGPTRESKNIDIVLQGDYLAVKNFIHEILIDLDLQFKAENIVITQSGDAVQATFTISDVKVVM